MAMLFPSMEPMQWGVFHSFMNSSDMFFNASCGQDAFKYFSCKASHNAQHVSLIMLLTVVLPIR
jgi:hypothetical protein